MIKVDNKLSRPAAVVLGLSPTGLYVIRELGRNGISVTGISDSRQAGSASRYLSACIIEKDPARRLERLMSQFSGADLKPVLIPTSDQDIEFVMVNAEELKGAFSFQLSYSNGLANDILTKETFYQLCQANNVAYPRLRKGSIKEVAGFEEQISYPCMIKPSRIHDIKSQMAGQKGWIVRNASELHQTLRRIPPEAGTLLCQEIVPGPESAITLFCAYFDGNGGVHQPFTSRKLRQYPPGFGSASTVQSCAEPETARIAADFLNAIGYQGIAAAEFKREPDTGQLKIIEINPRPSLWFSISGAAGKHVTLAAYHAMSGSSVTLDESPQRDGVRWRYRGKDMYSAAFYRVSKGFVLPPPDLSAVGPPRSHTSPVFQRDDPRPVFAEALGLVGKAVSRLLRRLHVTG